MRRSATLWLAVIVFALAGGGAGAFTYSDATGPGPVRCGSSRLLATQCIPGIRGETVLRMLEQRGFTCEMEAICEIVIGSTRYEAHITSHEHVDHLIAGFELDVISDPRLEPTPGMVAFFTWFLELPFTNDPEGAAVSRDWLAEHLGGDHEVKIRDFDFALAAPNPGHVRLAFDGVPDPDVPMTDDGGPPPMPTFAPFAPGGS